MSKLPDVSSKYGAPMGRRDHYGRGVKSPRLTVSAVTLDSGGYDNGGAYWGGGVSLWHVTSECGDISYFMRAPSRGQAEELARERHPGATLESEFGTASDDSGIATDAIADGYIDAMLWLIEKPEGDGEDGHALEFWEATRDAIAPETLAKMIADCEAFKTAAAFDILRAVAAGMTPKRIGHDLFLTSQGHGSGFWDREELEADGLGERLSEAARKIGAPDYMVGDDGLIYRM